MSTLTLTLINSLVRSDLNESSTTILSDAEITSITNDGYKDTAVKGLCFESEISKTIAAGGKVIPLAGSNVIRVNYVEYKAGSTEGGWGALAILPQTVGHITAALMDVSLRGGPPQYWFQWGDNLVIEPAADAGTYNIKIYASCYPTAAITTSLTNLPVEFHECVYLFTLAYSALKLRRWGDAALAYNRYIISVQQKRAEYISKYAEPRFVHDLPENVELKNPNQKGQ
jgi:hypothetical protein